MRADVRAPGAPLCTYAGRCFFAPATSLARTWNDPAAGCSRRRGLRRDMSL